MFHQSLTTVNTNNKLLLELSKSETDAVQSGIASPIPQVDGAGVDNTVMFSFVSDYGEEDVLHSLSETFSNTEVSSTTLVSRVRVRPKSADHHCIVELKLEAGQIQNFSWPEMKPWIKDTFQDIRRILK